MVAHTIICPMCEHQTNFVGEVSDEQFRNFKCEKCGWEPPKNPVKHATKLSSGETLEHMKPTDRVELPPELVARNKEIAAAELVRLKVKELENAIHDAEKLGLVVYIDQDLIDYSSRTGNRKMTNWIEVKIHKSM